MARRASKKTVQVRAKFEPDNIEDKNAIKFEVLLDGTWYIIGYCGVKKIPKLHKGLLTMRLKLYLYSLLKDSGFLGEAALNLTPVLVL